MSTAFILVVILSATLAMRAFAGPVDLAGMTVADVHSRGLHEIGPFDKTSLPGRIAYCSVALVALAILVGCFVRRAKNLSMQSLREMNTLRVLVILIYLLGLAFVVSGIILQMGIGLDTAKRCKTAIDLCLVFYVGGKVMIYVFLVERAHAIRTARYRRHQDWVWVVSMLIVLVGFGTIAIFAFLRPVIDISNVDGKCRIGLPLEITLPLLVYDVLMNLGMTALFFFLVRPYLRKWGPSFPDCLGRTQRRLKRALNKKSLDTDPADCGLDTRGTLEKLARKSFAASVCILLGTVVNLSVLFKLRGRELGWLCYMLCTFDVTWGVIVIHSVTADASELDSAPRNSNISVNRRSAFSIAGDEADVPPQSPHSRH